MGSSFKNNLKVEFLGVSDNVRILDRLSYYSEDVFPGLVVTLDPGFISDLESIPEFLKGIVRGSANRYKRAYVIHDALYRLYAYYEIMNPNLVPPRDHELIDEIDLKVSDLLLDEGLKVLGMGCYTRSKIYYPLRMFGSPTNDKELVEQSIPFIKLEKYDSIVDAKEACAIAKFETGDYKK